MFASRQITSLNGPKTADQWSIEHQKDLLDYANQQEHITLSNPSHFQTIFRGDFSISIWTRVVEGQLGGAVRHIFSYKNAGTGGDSLTISISTTGLPNGVIWFGMANGIDTQYNYTVDPYLLPDGDTGWIHLVVSAGFSSGLKVIKDGEIWRDQALLSAMSAETWGLMTCSAAPAILAKNNNGTLESGVGGQVSDFAIYNKALDYNEALEIYNNREAFDHTDWRSGHHCKGWWRFGDEEAFTTSIDAPVFDHSGNGITGTLSSMDQGDIEPESPGDI